MSKIIKKISAAFLLILMIFSVSYNLISYAAEGETVTITSSKVKLIVRKDFYDNYNASTWNSWLARYDRYYDILRSYTGVDPLAENGESYITIDISSNISGAQARTGGRSIVGDKTCFEAELNSILNSSSEESGVLLHEFSHVFQYHKSNYFFDWCFEPEILAGILANYVYKQSSASTVIGTDGYTIYRFNQYETFRNNNAGGVYDDYYSISSILERVNGQVSGLSSAIKTLNTGSSKSNSEKFNLLIDTWSSISGQDVWAYFSKNEINKISSVLGGEIGPNENLTLEISELSLQGNKSGKNTLKFEKEGDTQATITVKVKTQKQPNEVRITLGDQSFAINNPSNSGNTYTYTATVNLTESTQKALLNNKILRVNVTDANGNPYDKETPLTVEENEEKTIKITSLKAKGEKTNKENSFNKEKDTKLIITATIETNEENLTPSLYINGTKTGDLGRGTKTNNTITYTKEITIPEDMKQQENILVTIYAEVGEQAETDEITVKIESEETSISKVTAVGDKKGKDGEFYQGEDTKLIFTVEVKTAEEPNNLELEITDLMDLELTPTASANNNGTITYKGEITVPDNYIGETEETLSFRIILTNKNTGDTKNTEKTVKIVKNGEVNISDIKFIQAGKGTANVYDCSDETNKTATLTVSIEGIGENGLKNLVVSQFTGFKTTSADPQDKGPINQEGTGRQYVLDLEYTKLTKEDCEERDGKYYVTCHLIAILNDSEHTTIEKDLEIEVQNPGDGNLDYKFYYQIDVNKEQEITELGQTITLPAHAGNMSLITAVKADTSDTSKYNVTFNGTSFEHPKYIEDENLTEYSLIVKESGTIEIKFNDVLVVKYVCTINEVTDTPDTPDTPSTPATGETIGKIKNTKQYLYLYNYQSSGSGNSVSSNSAKSHTDRYEPNNSDSTGGEKNWIIRDMSDKEIQYMCYNHGIGIKFTGGAYYYKYQKQGEVNLSSKQQLVLAFLEHVTDDEAAKIAGTTLPKNWRENAKQYYVWQEVKGQGANYGTAIGKIINTISSSENDYIDYTNQTITMKNDKGETYTYKIKKFSATQYNVCAKLYSSTGNAAWTSGDDRANYQQPLFTYSCVLEGSGGPTIKLKKVDANDENKILPGTKFTLYKEDGKTAIETYEIKEDGYVEIPLESGENYVIKETEAPKGYIKTNQYAEISVDKDGKIDYSIIDPDTNKDVTEDLIEGNWIETETDKDYNGLTLTVKNKPTIKIIPKKIDEEGNPLGGAVFGLWEEYDENGNKKYELIKKYQSMLNGYTQQYLELETEKTYILREEVSPDGYDLSTQYVKIITAKDGKIDTEIWNNNGTPDNTKDDELLGEEKENAWAQETELSETWPDVENIKLDLILILEDKPNIKLKLHKIDNEENPLPGARITIYNETGKEELDTVETDENGDAELSVGRNKTYIIKENLAPDGYITTKEYTKIKIGKSKEDVEVKFYNEEGQEINNSLWTYGEEISTDENEETVGLLTLKNIPKIKLIPQKLNETGYEGLAGASFVIFEYNYQEGYKTDKSPQQSTSQEDGYGNKIFELETNKYYIIEEAGAPQGYKKTKQSIIIYVDQNRTISTVKIIGKEENEEQENQEEDAWSLSNEEGEKDGKKYSAVVKLKDQPITRIKIIKVDQDGRPISEPATFNIDGIEFVTQGNGESEEKPLGEIKEDGIYEVVETNSPDGYKKLEESIKLKIETEENSDKIIKVTITEGSDVAQVQYDSEKQLITITITNEEDEPPEYDIYIKKIDSSDNRPMEGVKFSFTGDINGSYTTDGNGNIGPLTIKKEDTTQDYSVTIQETDIPKPESEDDIEYNKIEEPINIKIPVKENGTSAKPQLITQAVGITMSVSEKDEEGKATIIITIPNNRKIKETKMPLLMYIEGQVWLDNPAGKESEINEKYDGENEDLAGILVTICEKGSEYAAPIAKSQDIEDIISKATETPEEITEHIEKLKELEEKYGTPNIVETDSQGKFAFYGLDPDIAYTIQFTYNGMRYEALQASAITEISGMNYEEEIKKSRATEDSVRRQEIKTRFAEIGPYPYNYHSEIKGGYNKAYTQMQVQEAINEAVQSAGSYIKLYGDSRYSNLENYIEDEDLVTFMKDTSINATIQTEAILEYAEDIIKAENDNIDDTIYAGYVYPVIQLVGVPNPENTETGYFNTKDDAIQFYKNDYVNINEKNERLGVGYKVKHWRVYNQLYYAFGMNCQVDGVIQPPLVSKTPMWFTVEEYPIPTGPVVDYEAWLAEQFDGEDYYKDKKHKVTPNPPRDTGDGEAHIEITGDPPKPTIVGYHNTWNIHYEKTDTDGYQLEVYEVKEGYTKIKENNIRVAKFDMNSEPYYDVIPVSRGETVGFTDEYTGKFHKGMSGKYNTNWGWKQNQVSALEVAKKLSKYVNAINKNEIEKTLNEMESIDELKEKIEALSKQTYTSTNSKTVVNNPQLNTYQDIIKKRFLLHENLGVKYRPTLDLGLYNDVQKAYIKTGPRQYEQTYIYDKRAANGGAFRFGVNDYDIGEPPDIEEQYEEYYTNLTEGESTQNTAKSTIEKYENLRQKEDILPNQTMGETNTGTAEAGGFNPFETTIILTYRIRIINQSGTPSKITELVDYFDSNFEFVSAKDESGTPLQISDESIYKTINWGDWSEKAEAPEGYSTKYIKLNEEWTLENNQYKDIFVDLVMKDPQSTLASYLEAGGEGYKTLNYAEINGYKTEIGVIDVDSVPGNLIDDGEERFPNGIYEDDEGKSPTFIIRNPGDKERTISGSLFEDEATLLKDVKSHTGMERNGNGTLEEGIDTKIIGGHVELIEVDENGNVVLNQSGSEVRASTPTDGEGNYKFTKIPPANYLIRFHYGDNDQTVLMNYNGGSNQKSYNGESYENTQPLNHNNSNPYWYFQNEQTRSSDAIDDQTQRNKVIQYAQKLTNEKAEIFNSYKDKEPVKELVEKVKKETPMYADTALMVLEVENYKTYNDRLVKEAADKTSGDYQYNIINVDFGIVERERAELELTKNVSEIQILDSTGKEITGGKAGEKIKYVKWIPNDDKTGFIDMEIDKELLSGAILKVTYEITVKNNSETSNENQNTIQSIKLIDYVSNNLNFDVSYGEGNDVWKPVPVDTITPYLNKTSLEDEIGGENKIDLTTYQTTLMAEIDSLAPGEPKTLKLTLEKNLSQEEESDFSYENRAEIIETFNQSGRSDFSSIYGNLDPLTNTSRQGNLNWEQITNKYQHQENGFAQEITTIADDISSNAIREAEKDSGNAEEVIITPPTGAKGIVLQTQHYILAIIFLATLAGTAILLKKYIAISKE